MSDVIIRTMDGGRTILNRRTLDRLGATLRGEILDRRAPAYDQARSIWNARIDHRPALIARCRRETDVVRLVRFAREHELLISIRSGGHNIAGSAVIEEGLVIDLSPMKAVRVDPRGRTARAEPGVTLGGLDRETQLFGLATPVGINSSTGLAGLALGGGFGWLTRRFGLTVDNLRSADVVTADGELITANEAENPDLFWALRGGSGNFGVVTSFEFALHQVGPDVLAGVIVHPFERASELLREFREVVAEAPDELSVWAVLRRAPPLPFLPPSVHGREVVLFAALYAGPTETGDRALQALRRIGRPLADEITLRPYAAFQQAFDPLLAPGARNYWKSHNFQRLSDALIDKAVDFAGRLPTSQCEVFLAHLGGAASRKPTDATAYVHRDAEFVMNVHSRWDQAIQDEECVTWARALFNATAGDATGGTYVNFLTEDEPGRVGAAFGQNYPRLAELKARYDPGNLFRANQNIRPTVGRAG
jgi:FAD/FMN-containing dehydrogenase